MKRRFIPKLILITILFVLFFLFPKKSLAEAQNKTIIYDINENNVANITYQIKLINEDVNTYISRYTLSTGLEAVASIYAQTSDGRQLSYLLRETDGAKLIEVIFPQPKKYEREINWSLNFTSNEPVKKIGKVRELTVPGFVGEQELSVIIKWPKSFGKPNYISLNPAEIKDEDGKYIYTFTNPQIKNSGVFLSIGETQLFEFSYKYRLKNDETTRMRATITLPPDYKNQKIFFNKAEPEPDSTFKDADGNYIVEYLIEPNEDYEVSITGSAELSIDFEDEFVELKNGIGKYLNSDLYWESENKSIINLANEIIKNKVSKYDKARAIYEYVVKELKYNEQKLINGDHARLGAANVLKQKDNAICQEFTDLFIALCRAAGVPARMLAGYTTAGIGYDLPPNTLHAWAEFYSDEGKWVTVDPTWESTSNGFNFFGNVGLNHFVLAIRGNDSENPALVLSFISADDSSDNLKILPVDVSPKRTESIELSASIPDEIMTLARTNGTINIFNDTNQILSDIYINISSVSTSSSLPVFDKTTAIFPGETMEVEFTLTPNKLFLSRSDTLNVLFSATHGEKERITLEKKQQFDIKTNNILNLVFIIGAAGLSVVIVLSLKRFMNKYRERSDN